MVSKVSRAAVRVEKHRRIRRHLSGTAERPRLAVLEATITFTRRLLMTLLERH